MGLTLAVLKDVVQIIPARPNFIKLDLNTEKHNDKCAVCLLWASPDAICQISPSINSDLIALTAFSNDKTERRFFFSFFFSFLHHVEEHRIG